MSLPEPPRGDCEYEQTRWWMRDVEGEHGYRFTVFSPRPNPDGEGWEPVFRRVER